MAALALAFAGPSAVGQPAQGGYTPPVHTQGIPALIQRGGRAALATALEDGMQIEQRRSVAEILARQERMAKIGAGLSPQRAGVVDAYVISAALDSDGVFGREARATAKVLETRYGAAGRTIVLAGSDGSGPSEYAIGSPESLAVALGKVARVMDRNEDVLVLFTTSHGAPAGVVYNDGDSGFGGISPNRLAAMLDELGIRKRLLLISACFSGVFADRLQAPDTAILTAAHSTRTSFGCAAENDWTFFGDALVNHAMRKPQATEAAFYEAAANIAAWEGEGRIEPSMPQIRIGENAHAWLRTIDARAPANGGAPVGRPSRFQR